MRRLLILPLFAIAASACAPRIQRSVEPAPIPAAAPIPLANGPEGESSWPGSSPASGTARGPALATAAMVPSPRMAAAIERLREKELIIPVAGISPSRIEDTFSAGRSGDRQHNASDILAPRNTPVLAADGGTILRMSTNQLGGITIYTADAAREFVYYYAHLERYHEGLLPGNQIQKGDTLGYVGTTGNSPADVPHLHFQIMLWPSDGKWWNGEPVNPYPVLRGVTTSAGARLRFD